MMKKRCLFTFIFIFLALILVFVWNVCAGSIYFSPAEIFKVFCGKEENSVLVRIVKNIRLPRICTALLLGGALAVSGFLLQTFFANPLAGPYVLGISSGAKLFVALTMIFFLERGYAIGSFGMVLSAFLGAMASLFVILLLSFKVKNMSVLVVCGIMIGYICSALTDFFITFANDSNIVNLHNWSLGSFSGSSWSDVFFIAPLVLTVCVAVFFLSKPIDAYELGEDYAQNMGVHVKILRFALIILSSLLSACVTAFAGPISFIGIAVPHLARLSSGENRSLFLVPLCFFLGAFVSLFCDGIARTLFAPTEFSISTVTAVFLVPVVIFMMISNQKKNLG